MPRYDDTGNRNHDRRGMELYAINNSNDRNIRHGDGRICRHGDGSLYIIGRLCKDTADHG